MLTFLHPAFLWFAPLALVPVILHLLSRIAPLSLRFPTTRFLHNSPMPLQGRRRWQDILLMLVRTALIAVIVLLIAQPCWKNPPTSLMPEKEGCIAILDVSPSMYACVDELRDETTKLPADTTFITTENQPTSPNDWIIGFTAPGPSKALENAAKYLEAFPRSARTLHIFSDLQSSNWSEEMPNMPEGTNIIVHTNADKVMTNWSVVSTRCEYIGDNKLRILATCRNWSENAETRTVELSLDGKAYRRKLSLAPNSSAPALFIVPIPSDSHAEISILPEDKFPFDDTKAFWASPPPPHPVLAVFSSEDEKITEELEFFTIPALLSEPDDAPQRYTANTLDISGLPYAELSSQSVVFLLGAADRLGDDAAEILHEYVAEGGVLISVPGASPLAGWRFLQKTGLAPRGTATLEKQPTGIGALKPSDELHTLFPEKNPSDLHLFNIKKHIRISAIDDSDNVLLKTIEGDPALIRRYVGKGQILLFTFGLDTLSSDFPLTKSFLPLLRELLSQALDSRTEIISIVCGDSIPELKTLDGTAEQFPLDTSEPGLDKWANRLVEINVPLQESTIRYRKPDEITRALSENSTTQFVKADDNIRPLSAFCAAALVVLLLLESLMSFGGRKIQKQQAN